MLPFVKRAVIDAMSGSCRLTTWSLSRHASAGARRQVETKFSLGRIQVLIRLTWSPSPNQPCDRVPVPLGAPARRLPGAVSDLHDAPHRVAAGGAEANAAERIVCQVDAALVLEGAQRVAEHDGCPGLARDQARHDQRQCPRSETRPARWRRWRPACVPGPWAAAQRARHAKTGGPARRSANAQPRSCVRMISTRPARSRTAFTMCSVPPGPSPPSPFHKAISRTLSRP